MLQPLHASQCCGERAPLMLDVATQHLCSRAQIKGTDLGSRFCHPLPGHSKSQPHSNRKRGKKLVSLLAPEPDRHFHLPESAMRLQIAHAMPPLRKVITHLLDQVTRMLSDALLDLLV